MTSKLINGMLTGTTTTENGAITNASTLNPLLDLFFVIASSRNMEEQELINLFVKAYHYDQLTTIKMLFWTRDIRGGAGERRAFRVLWKYFFENYQLDATKFLYLVPFFGRWDDVWANIKLNDDIFNLVFDALMKKDSLVAKWLPRKGKIAKFFQKKLKINEKEWRKMVVELSSTVEQKMSAREWEDIVFSHVPSIAMKKYKSAFLKHQDERFVQYISDVLNGKEKINASVLFPHDIVSQYYNSDKNKNIENVLIAQWDNLPQYTGKGEILPVVDVSGSMKMLIGKTELRVFDVAIGLGVYLSEHIEGAFKDSIISFSGRPNVHKLSGNILEKIEQVAESGEDMNTNLAGVFETLLQVAKRDNLSEKDMPKKLLIISDMEFDSVGNNTTNFENIKHIYKEAGYEMPTLVFWNVLGRVKNYPTNKDDKAVLLSGYSPSNLKAVLEDNFDPVSAMESILNQERYDIIEEIYKTQKSLEK